MPDQARAYSYVRMSTPEQLKGHGRQRQLEASAKYAKEHGLELVEDWLEDIGVSAFTGSNVTDGALGQFLEAAENGSIETGSYLLVESLDRISRQEIRKSLSLFLRIVEAGINLVTLQDGRVYRTTQKDFSVDLIVSISILGRAHEESLTKSRRINAAWANKRRHANTTPLTKWCPAWLKLNKDRKAFEIIPERAAIVRSIFEDTVSGIGGYVITKRLNEKKVPIFGTSNGWHPSYIAKILTNRAVLGEYQPCSIINGKRKAIGDPIGDYFPRVIDDQLFYRAQQARHERRIQGRGRKGANLANLFSGIAKCAYCRSRIVFENKGPPPKGGTYLVCEAAKRGMGCVRTGWRYTDFESSFLAFVDQLDLPTLIRNDDSQIKTLDESIQALEGQLTTIEAEMAKAYELLQSTPTPIEFVSKKFSELQQRQDETNKSLETKRVERQELQSVEDSFYESKEEIKSLIERVQAQTSQGQDLYKLRSQLAARIKALIRELEIAPVGTGPIMEKLIKRVVAMEWDPEGEMMNIKGIKAAEHARYFEVIFKDGNELRIIPSKDDPLVLRQSLKTILYRLEGEPKSEVDS